LDFAYDGTKVVIANKGKSKWAKYAYVSIQENNALAVVNLQDNSL